MLHVCKNKKRTATDVGTSDSQKKKQKTATDGGASNSQSCTITVTGGKKQIVDDAVVGDEEGDGDEESDEPEESDEEDELNKPASREEVRKCLIKFKAYFKEDIVYANIINLHDRILQLEEEFLKMQMSKKDESFENRCKLEDEYIVQNFKPLYDERHELAKNFANFWYGAFASSVFIQRKMSPDDKDALNYLEDIRSQRTENMKGFVLSFYFQDNSYFENKVLTKTFELNGDNQSITLKTVGTDIKWKSSQKLVDSILHVKLFKSLVVQQVVEPSNSLFNFFGSKVYPDKFHFDEDEDGLKGRNNLPIPIDYVMGIWIRDRIIPHAIARHFGAEDDVGYGVGVEMEEWEDIYRKLKPHVY